jgi:hypothetical protein
MHIRISLLRPLLVSVDAFGVFVGGQAEGASFFPTAGLDFGDFTFYPFPNVGNHPQNGLFIDQFRTLFGPRGDNVSVLFAFPRIFFVCQVPEK